MLSVALKLFTSPNTKKAIRPQLLVRGTNQRMRLVDIPVAPVAGEQEEKAVVVPVLPTKVAIKQRPTKGGRNNGLGPGGNGGKLNPSKSLAPCVVVLISSARSLQPWLLLQL
jgi:hypothetical protein